MHRLILLRHGESLWNKENRFTGWTDVELSKEGREEARRAARLLSSFRLNFDITFCSVLKRAIKTANIVADEMNRLWTPQVKHWRLNERHYGALQGLNKQAVADRYGTEQVHIWRRSYDVRPPQLEGDDPRCPRFDPAYADVDPALLPHGESLQDTVERVIPYWTSAIVPRITEGRTVMIAAHGNSLRALVMYLEQLGAEEILQVEIPTAVPFVYELDDGLNPLKRYYLG